MRTFVYCLLLLLPAASLSQNKTFSYDQLFTGSFPAVFNRLPAIEKWIDDDHYLEARTGRDGNEQLFSVNAVTGKTTPYTQAAAEEKPEKEIPGARNITPSPDGRYLAYTRENNLYVREQTSGKETALTADGSDVILNGYASWVYYEEILGRSSQYKAFWWSPDSRNIAFMRFDESRVPLFPIYFADGTYGHLENQRYPKAGDRNPEVKIGITPIAAPATVWADFNPAQDQYFGTPAWTPGNQFWVQWMNRGQDTLVVYQVSSADGSKKEIYRETQQTWIDLDEEERFTFLKGNQGVIVKSDRDGWENLYLHDLNGRLINRITTGNFWGTSVLHVDETNKQLYIRARKDHSARFDLYRVSWNGRSVVRLSSGDFSYDMAEVSPSGKHVIALYSNLSTPPAMAVLDQKGKIVRELGSMKGPEFSNYFIPRTKLMTVKSSDGLFDLPVTITYPLGFDSTKKYPVWISVYGGPNAGTVYDRWKPAGGLGQWLAQEGVIQVSMDNRSSGHFGKKGINHIHRQLGLWEIKDYVDCARWLRAQRWVDTAKVGITGGSFGGYLTCMALTYGAEVFTHGIANYSVTDWKLYDTHYTERFMKTPAENPEGYRNTSVFTYTDRYKGVLRIVHGSTDDNVHMQNSLQLISAFQDMNKSFELMIYPNQRHGIGGTKAGFNLRQTAGFVYRHLLGKDLPARFTE